MVQRRHVLHEVLLRPEHRSDPVAGVVGAQLHGHGPIHDGAHALAHAPRGLGPDVPDAPERAEHVGAGHVAYRHAADDREHVARQARQPVPGVLGIAPAAMLVGPDPLGGLGEGGHAPGALLLGQRVAAGACGLAVGERPGARFLERDEREGAEAQLVPPAADDEPLDQLRVPLGLTSR